ncbi:T9SS type A sorting domain-containing protein [Chryseobacterium tongliaoense]|uniref:T9SS type A sorting domain-containing protein n=1 Tax=Chryseobacterium tongliaoense TaxID=3240933 RepID=UPI00351994ED
MTLIVKSQVTVAFKDFKVNNNAHSISNPINLGTGGSVNVKFTVLLTKSSTYVVGNCKLFIRTYNSYGQYTDLVDPLNIYLPDSGTSFATAIDANISSTYITYEPGNYLSVELVAQSSGAVWYSPRPVVVKTPSFTLSPTSITIPCGSTSPVTLTCNSSTNVGTYVYKWNVGTGWNKDGSPVSGIITTSTNSITLSPTDPNILPSNISLEIIWNTNYSFGMTCLVKREIFDSSGSLQISGGSPTVCTFPATQSFSINSGSGNTVSWTSSDSSVGEVQTVNGTSTSVIVKRQGEFTLTATVSNSCNQTKIVTKKVWAGTPLVYMPNAYCGNPYDSVCFNSNYNVPTGQYSNVVVDALGFDGTPNLDTDFEWEKIDGPFTFASYGNGYYSNVSNNGTKVTGRMAILYITSGYNYMQVRARAKNSCGWGPWKNILFQSGGSKMSLSIKNYKVSPNPATDYINIVPADENDTEINKSTAIVFAELFNAAGVRVGKTELQHNKGKIYVNGLNQGVYTLKIYTNKQQEDHQVIIK